MVSVKHFGDSFQIEIKFLCMSYRDKKVGIKDVINVLHSKKLPKIIVFDLDCIYRYKYIIRHFMAILG